MTSEALKSRTEAPEELDVAALREKYRHEAEKRRKGESNRRYRTMSDESRHTYAHDPYSPPIVRDPIAEDVDVVVLGGGFAGLLAAARLKEQGVASMRIIDMAGDFGGTWYWNRYPGAQCDVESYCYLPLLEETGFIPTQRYSYGPEIFEHCRRIARTFALYEHALFQTVVQTMRWDETIRRWRIATNRGDEIRARYLVMGPGPLANPKFPSVPGLSDFAGHSFHTARWDYAYTGGDPTGNLVGLEGKRVAVIGTGATGIQAIPHVARHAEHLYVFQRTPSAVDERGNRPTDPEWAKTLRPGWQAERQRNFHVGANERFAPDELDLVHDGWTEINRTLQAIVGDREPTAAEWAALREEQDFRIMERVRQRVGSIVEDAETAETLKAWYRFGCKRPCFNDDYLPTFNRPNVTLVDVSDANGVDRITPRGIVAGGREYEVDCIIFASGFEVTDDLKRRFAIDAIDGRDGLSLYDHWGERMQSLHGMSSHGFPNFFFTGYGQGGVSGSITLGYDLQAKHIAHIVKTALPEGRVVEPTWEAQQDWLDTISRHLSFDTAFWHECTPSYLNGEGAAIKKYTVWGEPYGGGYYAFEEILETWRNEGMPGMSVS